MKQDNKNKRISLNNNIAPFKAANLKKLNTML
ncbi:hypothetical protein BH11BAC3_BH11BAC3_05130 [soil metagenome]